jgi:hypothetical protein
MKINILKNLLKKLVIKIIKNRDKQVVNTMFNRAKYHLYQTSEMREAMKIFKKFLNKEEFQKELI